MNLFMYCNMAYVQRCQREVLKSILVWTNGAWNERVQNVLLIHSSIKQHPTQYKHVITSGICHFLLIAIPCQSKTNI